MKHLFLGDYLPLPAPFPDYLTCPRCGEPEVEIWCYETRTRCHRCGAWLVHQPETSCCIQRRCLRGEARSTCRSD